ncbi:ABC transporter permease [Desulfosporosinus fructosivorans]|uniref:ABC transporter permease n=1 Tax=Desulfosporosinus fructosivorans TaxID=2018669 RepID=A0A4Z0R3Z8_9FIRM|nr:ABC transporter permease [Desulfosporosinus fructosivorans]TGE37115.1 ABC transporter permease [Desulfosporosinus fructosivorans]
MLKLIRLEMLKNNAAKYALYSVIVILSLTALSVGFVFFLGFEDPEIAEGIIGVSFFVEMLTGIVFLIFTAIMHSAFTINAYKNKTMDLMFSYPIKRGKILASKIIAVLGFNFVSIIVAQVIIYGSIYIASRYLQPSIKIDFDILNITFYVSVVIKSVMTICISLIALFVGMISKSPVATIVASFFLAVLLKGNIGGFSLAGSVVFPIVLTFISIVFAFLTIRDVEKKDVV